MKNVKKQSKAEPSSKPTKAGKSETSAKPEINSEQLILEAAEAEFLEKGYNNAKTTDIAKRAGVTHALLHYYFRKKENLFQKVFQHKVQLVGDSFYESVNDKHRSFEAIIRNFVETHFDFLKENPKLLFFIYNEVINDKNNRQFFIDQVRPKMGSVVGRMDNLLSKEIKKRTIRPIKVSDLFLNIMALNAVTFMALSVADDVMPDKNSKFFETMVNERRESNVKFILNALKA